MISVLLFVLAWIGHCYVLMLLLNFTYSLPVNREFLKKFRTLVAITAFIVPPIVGYFLPIDLYAAFQESRISWWSIYGLFCLVFFVLFLIATISRLIRKSPSIVQEETSNFVDTAKSLGVRAVGEGKHSKVAAWKVNQIFNVEFTRLTLTVKELPQAWDGLTILHLSDLHFYGSPDLPHYQEIMRIAMNDGVPDLVVISGDLIDDDIYLPWIRECLGMLKWKEAAFAIVGNHDWWNDFEKVRHELNHLNMTVLGNRWMQTTIRGLPLIAIGHEGPWFRPSPDLSDCPEGFRLLISHTPDNIRWARRNKIHLMLSGHNHGGQIRIPIMGSMFVPSKYSRRYDMGTFFESPTALHVNRGLSGKEPIRFRCPPQVSRITLKCSKSSDS